VTLEACLAPGLPRPVALVEALKVPYGLLPSLGPHFAAILDALGPLEGYPLLLVWRYAVLGLNVETSSEATQIRREALAPSVFEPLPGLTRRLSPFLAASSTAVTAPAPAVSPAPTPTPPPAVPAPPPLAQ
jgi:hypothetical protein